MEVFKTFEDGVEDAGNFEFIKGPVSAFDKISNTASVAVFNDQPKIIVFQVATEVADNMRALALL